MMVKEGKLSFIIEFILLALIFFRPFVSGIVYPWSNAPTQICIFFLLILWFINMSLERKFRLFSTPLNFPILLFLLIAILSTIFSLNRGESLTSLYQLASYLLFYLLIVNHLSWSKVPRTLALFLTAGFLLSLYAIYQHRFALPSLYQRLDTITALGSGEIEEIRARIASQRVFSTFVLPSSFAGYLALVTPLGVGLFISRSSLQERILLGIVVLTMLWALIFTFSLGGILALAFALLFISLILLKKMRWFIPILLILFLLLGIASFHSEDLYSKVTLRLYNWRSAIEIVKDHPFLGTGIGTFATVYPGYKFPQANEVHYAHNWYLQVASEMGILGLGALLWLLATFIKEGIKNLRTEEKKSQRAIIAGLLAGGFASLFHNLVDMDAYVPEIALLWWAVMGLIMLKSKSNAKNSMKPQVNPAPACRSGVNTDVHRTKG